MASEVVEMFTGVGVAATVMLRGCVAVPGVGVAESVTMAVKLNAPVAVGAPEMAPVVGAKARPGGSAPALTLQVYGAEPPVADSVVAYVCCAVAAGKEVVKKRRAAAVTCPDSEVALPQPAEERISAMMKERKRTALRAIVSRRGLETLRESVKDRARLQIYPRPR